MISASSVPRKLKNLKDVFHHKEDYTDCTKLEMKVNKLNTEELFKAEKEEPVKSNIAPKVGKLKLEANVFENAVSEESVTKSLEIKVGKIDVENIFKAWTPDKEEENRDSPKVGKSLFVSLSQNWRHALDVGSLAFSDDGLLIFSRT